MVITNNLLKELKSALFDLTILIGTINRENLMLKLSHVLKREIKSDNVSIFLESKWEVGDRLKTYSINDCPDDAYELALEALSDYSNFPKLKTIHMNSTQYQMIKIEYESHFNGLIVLSCDYSNETDEFLLKSIGELTLNFLTIEYVQYRDQHSRKRMNYFFQLSAELHGVNRTEEVLSSMYTAFQKVFPFFDFSLLMTQEYACEGVPITLLEYKGDLASSPGTMAFIDNKLKIDMCYDKNEVQLYSPLSGQQGVYGVVRIVIPQMINESKLDLDIIERLSNMAGTAIERTILFQSSNKQISNLQMINQASHELNMKLDREEIIDVVKKYILKTSKATEFAVVLWDEFFKEGNHTTYQILHGSTSYFFNKDGENFIDHLTNLFAKENTPILSGNYRSNYQESPFHSLIAIPMWSTDMIFGFIVMAHPEAYRFTLDKFKIIQSFVQHASLAFKNLLLKEQLHEMAITDYLTKLYLRNHLDTKLAEYMQTHLSGTFALFDIDDFKHVNDTYGHHAGDEVLVDAAMVIKEIMAETNGIAARWGGEEFALCFPGWNLTETVNKVNEIREKVNQTTRPSITFSCGVAEWRKESMVDSEKALFIKADEALYEAKLLKKIKRLPNLVEHQEKQQYCCFSFL